MPIPLIAEIVPKNNGAFALIDDNNLRGGFRTVVDLASRDAIPTDKRKQGMLVYVIDVDTRYSLTSDLVTWTEIGSRSRFSLQIINSTPILSGDIWDFEIAIGGNVSMLLQLVLDAACAVEIHSTPERADTNPYKFIGTPDHLADDGSTIMSDGSVIYGRRYSILANMETPLNKTTFGRIINNTEASIPTVSITLELLPQ